MLWRHGDVLLAATDGVPRPARRRQTAVLVWGEVTGHSHRVADPATASLWQAGADLFLEVTAPTATIVHEEHRPLTLPAGVYRVWTQREYSPLQIRRVVD